MISDKHTVAMGASHGHFGLWIDRYFEKGGTHPVDTFKNEALASNSFECYCVELWGFEV